MRSLIRMTRCPPGVMLMAAGLAPGLAVAAPAGAALYAQNCSSCHQADANGLAGQFPPLRGRVDKIAAPADGRHYLADILIHGMAGSIQVGSDTYVGYMPAFAQLPDDQIATILDWVSSLGSTKPVPTVATTELAAARTRTLKPADVLAERTALAAQHKLP